ncbi:hypothetical protein JOQ06_000356 [Pogonophryne albipinna]|uniref:Ig-like domain-containing protein n=1 Tax=Pogonophryne albipinna TaxID=1090488 RepID=A0AAD6F7B1_9TELE|nr:hypothetical protein JOQ06_000356 [Pogonophryne albipinna]
MWPPVFSMIVAGVLCVFPAVVSADSEIKLYKQVGDEVVLKPGPVSGTIMEISWKDGVNIAIEWDGKDIEPYRHFKVRGALNNATGEMTLRGLTLNDSGLYTAEINEVASEYPTRLIVILPVPKPTVSKTCDEEMTKCTLTCNAIITNAEPVEYGWNSNHSVPSTPVLHITKDESSSTFECWLKNPVSQQHSEPFPNPFTRKLNISAGLTVLIVLLVAVILTAIIHRIKAGMWFFEKASMPWEADFWRKHERPHAAESNGTAAQEGSTEEGTPMKPNDEA